MRRILIPNGNWKAFEQAVYQFAVAVSPDAKVIFDKKCLDRDTHSPRQVDVWVESTILGHVPLRIAISCKDYKRALDIGQIEKFHAELDSVGAHTGVLYSTSGFSKPAIHKAKALRISCCKLFRDESCKIPEALLFNSYLARSRLLFPTFYRGNLAVTDSCGIRQILDLMVESERGPISILEAIEIDFHEREKWSISQTDPERIFPPNWTSAMRFLATELSDLKIELGGIWRRFKGLQEAHLLKGSYCFTSGTFAGQQTSPVIDTRSSHPGPGWEETVEDPLRKSTLSMVAFQYGPDVKRAISQRLEEVGC